MHPSTHPVAVWPGRRSVLRFGAAAATAALLPPARTVTGYPSRPVTIVVPSAPGGALDLIARRLGQRLGQRWNTSVIVENKAGGVGTIGTNAVVRPKPDGHTLLLINAPLVQVPWLMKLPYDRLKDLSAVAKIADSYSMLAVHKSSPAKTLESSSPWPRRRPARPASAPGAWARARTCGGCCCRAMPAWT